MYQKLGPAEFKKHLELPDDYVVSGVLVMGNWDSEKYKKVVKVKLTEMFGDKIQIEGLIPHFFSSVISFVVDGKRFWYDTVYGQTYLSELLHIACLFGSKKNILIGSCGGLNPEGLAHDFVVPNQSFADESSTRMYDRNNNEYFYQSNEILSDRLAKKLEKKYKVFRGPMMTVQAMLAETEEDVQNWSKAKFDGVDMESGVIFAVSNYFKIPSAAMLYIADNLIKGQNLVQEEQKNAKELREELKNVQFEIALNELVAD